MSKYTFASRKTQQRIALLLSELTKQPMTRDEVQCLLGICKRSTLAYLAHLGAEPRCIYIKRWAVTGGPLAPVYALGNRPDAVRPPSLSDQERSKLEWQRIRSDRDKYDKAKAAARVRAAIHRMRGKPQPWFAALPGAQSVKAGKDVA